MYDDNGSMTEDHYKGIVTVYNHLTLPVVISKGTDSILLTYDAGGTLLRKQHKSGSTVVITRDYIGGIEYVNDTIDAIYHSEGRIKYIDEVARYEYYIRDHLGNIRITYSDLNADGLITTPDEIIEEMHYYAFGLMMEGSWMGDAGQYGYNGIEYENFLDLEMNLAMYRGLDPTLGRWWQVDPKAEAAFSHSPYNSMFNNPVSMSDPEGDLPFFAQLAGLTNGIRNLIEGNNFFEGFAHGWSQSWEITGGLFQFDRDLNFGQNLWNMVSKFTWEAPQTFLGLTVSQGLNIGTVVNDVNYFRGATVLDTDITLGAITIGSYISGPPGFRPDFTDHLFVHEFGHYLQSKRMGPFYMNFVALPSVTDIIFWPDRHDTRWYEAGASRLAADYFDREFGTGAPGYFEGSANHFDRNSFVNGTMSPYFNGRWIRSFAIFEPNQRAFPTVPQFHWSDILINSIYNNGFGLIGF